MKNQGISLISLIITIIVIIILAAIVIFTGLGTPDSANFAHFCQDVDNVQSAVLNSFADLKAKYATENKTRTNEQLYMEVATGSSTVNQYNHMTYSTDTVTAGTAGTGENVFKATPAADACQHISSTASKVANSLAVVRGSKNGWYVSANGQVFNATGYAYKVDGKDYTYFTANLRYGNGTASKGKLNATGDAYETRAKAIATVLNAGNTAFADSVTME